MANLSFVHQIRDRADALLDGHVRVDPVQVVDVDVIGTESPQRALAALARVLGAAVEA